MSSLVTAGSVLSLLAGFAVGLVYFGLLHRAVRMQLSDGPTLPVVGLLVLRFALVGVTFWLLVQHGALSLLLGFGGFLVGRFAVRRIVGA
jgi:tellurite resistance protein TehA-like permease